MLKKYHANVNGIFSAKEIVEIISVVLIDASSLLQVLKPDMHIISNKAVGMSTVNSHGHTCTVRQYLIFRILR